MRADCTFCQIVSGELPADLVHEDERTVAFMDISPATLGHVLVVPRRHVADVMSADAEDWLAVAATARRIARWVVGAFRAPGVDLVQANSDGSVGNQTVSHLHVHVLPRYHDDELGARWSPQTADPAEITEAARRLVHHARQDPETTPPLASSTS
jgi:histidine triad (HIT) family protein